MSRFPRSLPDLPMSCEINHNPDPQHAPHPWTVIAFAMHNGRKYRVYAWGFASNLNPVIPRLCRAINAGVIFDRFQLDEDFHGNLYIHARIRIHSRHMNSELKAIGF